MEDRYVLFRHIGYGVEYVFTISESKINAYIDYIRCGRMPAADKYEIYDRTKNQSIYIK